MLAKRYRSPGKRARRTWRQTSSSRPRICWSTHKKTWPIAPIPRQSATPRRRNRKPSKPWRLSSVPSKRPDSRRRWRTVTKYPDCRCSRFQVIGKVQGVFFRASTRDMAKRLGITGHAVNLPNGSVEVLACGSTASLESLRQWLHHGPAMARVDELLEEAMDCPIPSSFTTG